MHWDSLSEFLAMGEQGQYVWAALGVMLIAMILEPAGLIRRRKKLMDRREKTRCTERSGRDQ